MTKLLLTLPEYRALTQRIILAQQTYITHLGFTPVVHFELEGCFETDHTKPPITLNYTLINQALNQLGIDGVLVPEYWRNQWEYVSLFNGQSPLQEAQNLAQAMHVIPNLLAQQGVRRTLIKPVVWSGDVGMLAPHCQHVFSTEQRAVHIPNAVQINISAVDVAGDNIIPKQHFGEYLQQCFLTTSLACSLLYLPEQEAFERLLLRTKYGLTRELCSPTDISGGHQGSIALYQQLGKHNQKMGETALLYDHQSNVLVTDYNWQKTARVEHRLGASSCDYDPYINVIFALANLIDALIMYVNGGCQHHIQPSTTVEPLPNSLYDTTTATNTQLGAIRLFQQDNWLTQSINTCVKQIKYHCPNSYTDLPDNLGEQLKMAYLAKYLTVIHNQHER